MVLRELRPGDYAELLRIHRMVAGARPSACARAKHA
jgi:hypothetical protein